MLSISVDGGGSKLLAIVFNEKQQCLAVGKGSSVNTLFASIDEVQESIKNCILNMFEQLPENLKENDEFVFEDVFMTMAGPSDAFVKVLNQFAVTKRIHYFSEGVAGILAGTLCERGLLTLAGTGSDCFLTENYASYAIIGGWGAIFGDEGSGYDLGVQTIKAAIASYDGRGPKTILEDIVKEDFGCKNMWNITALYSSKNQRKDIARATKSLSSAIKKGDEVAISIIKKGAEELAYQAITLIKMRKPAFPLKMTIAGGAWKTSKIMINHFVNLVLSEFPEIEFVYPHFEPVMGGLIASNIMSGREITDKILLDIKQNFNDFIFRTDDDK